jgi:hypothetical protein
MRASRPNSWIYDEQKLGQGIVKQPNLEYRLNSRIVEDPHDFNADTLSANQPFPDISKSSPRQLLANLLQFQKR